MNKRSILILGIVALILISFSLATAQESAVMPQREATPITADKIMPITPPVAEKDECYLYYTDWGAAWYLGGLYPGDKVAIYFDPMDCGNPQNYPFQLTDVEFALYDFAGVGTIDVRFSVEQAYADSCLGPGPDIYLSPTYTITTFYPDIVHIDFPVDSAICLYEPFFFNLEYMSGVTGSIPSVLFDNNTPVDTCFQWVWYNVYSPPWWEHYDFWSTPEDVGWVVLGISGYTGDQTDCPWSNHKMHFPQLPAPGGWDVEFAASRLADDWMCSETGPVTDIHFWISWMQDNVLPIESFVVGIWSNDPIGPDGYSVPDTLLWERHFFPDDFTIIEWAPDLQGWLMPPAGGYFLNDHNRRFQINIEDIQDPFTQYEDTIYWLEIDFGPLPYIGWKETDQHWNDDAVIYDFMKWVEVIDPIDSTSIDLAFVITGEEECSAGDLGICDTLYVETFDCDHEYQAEPGSFDSVRVAIYVTHDSNTFWYEAESKWVQDSIRAFVVPLKFWHQPPGCADSVILPTHDQWNNDDINPSLPWMNRSMFRHIVDTHNGDTTYNRLLQMVENGKEPWTVITDIESHSCDGDSGHAWLAMIPASPACQSWWEGSRVLLATLTFHVYMADTCDTTEIGIDSMLWPPTSRLEFTRYDAVSYIPRHFLPVKDTIIVPRWNHFKTWETEKESFSQMVFVQDQFMEDYLTLMQIWYLSNPVKKVVDSDTFDIIRPDDHLTWYYAAGRDTLIEVEYVNQFESTTVVIGFGDGFLLVPTQKEDHDPPENLDHYKAYWIEDQIQFARELVLEDQFDIEYGQPEFITHLRPKLFLTPALKNYEEPMFDSITHYVAYEILPRRPFSLPVNTWDQFGSHVLNVRESSMLLVPTKKLRVTTPSESLYWKPDYEDYAPSGMPDFDQKQDDWDKFPVGWTFCGPVAVANCFWWYDSKYNQANPGAPGDGWDQFPLVRDYMDGLPPFIVPFWDDHDPWNVDHLTTLWGPPIGNPPPPTPQPFFPGPQPQPSGMPPWGELVERLAWYFDTDGIQSGYCEFSGTYVSDMQAGIDAWFLSEMFEDGSTLADTLYERTWEEPTFAWVETLVEKCQDVILLLGFWEEDPPGSGNWYRIGGHYVTVAGINSEEGLIAISDPYYDNAEAGGPGRVRNGWLIPHVPIPGHAPTVHNDAGNVSHDIYDVVDPSPSPGGLWALDGYPPASFKSPLSDWMSNFYNQNVPHEFRSVTAPWDGKQQIHTEVEYAVEISPWEYPPDCGDMQPDGSVNVSDVVYLTNFLFVPGSPAPYSRVKADVNHDGLVNISDVIYLINYLFVPGSPPPKCYDP